jgi:hypothetical protein
MKLLLFLSAVLLCASARTQELKPELKKFIEKQEFNRPIILQKNIPHPLQPGVSPKTDTISVNYIGGFMFRRNGQTVSQDSTMILLKEYLANRSKGSVRVLPQDKMPCIVPDTKDIAKIPNAWPGKIGPYKGSIPNAAQPKQQRVEVQPNK